MKTAMQQAIALVKKYENRLIPMGVLSYNLELLLEKEKEEIEDAYLKGYIHYLPKIDSKEYYNQNYNQKEETLEEWKSKFTHNCAIKDNQKQHIIDIMKADEDELEADRQTENQIEEEQINKHQNK